MTSVYISHSSADNAEAGHIKDWLAELGHERLFLDFDPERGIPAGVEWEETLYRELRRCQAILVILTPNWHASRWCNSELAIAREKGKPVFVVKAKLGTDRLIPAVQEVDLTIDRVAALKKLERGLLDHGLDPASSFDWKPSRPLYPGLPAFDIDDAAIYFGRSEETLECCEVLRHLQVQAPGSPKFLLITGASGSGKSSLMRAGMLARLRKEPAKWVVTKPLPCRSATFLDLADCVVGAFPPEHRPPSVDRVAADLAAPDGPDNLLALARAARAALDRPDATLILALDQMEDLLAAEPSAQADQLLNLLRATLARSRQEVLVAGTIRSDRLGAWQQHSAVAAAPEHAELLFRTFTLGPMPVTRLGEIVRGPARYVDLVVDDNLVDAMRADTPTSDALPLLAYTLAYLYNRHGSGRRLTVEQYKDLGGLDKAVGFQANLAIDADNIPVEDLEALRSAFVPGLVRITPEGTIGTSRALFALLPERARPYLRKLVDEARVLVTDRNVSGQETLAVAHEALLRVWPRLSKWIEDDEAKLRRFGALQRAAREFHDAPGRGDYLVHRDHRLAEVEELIAEPRFKTILTDGDAQYLKACREAKQKAKTIRQVRWATGGAVALVLLWLTWTAYQGKQESVARLMGEMATSYRAGDLTGAFARLSQIGSFWRPDNATVLSSFWADRLVALPEVIRRAGSPSVIAVNNRPVVILDSGEPHAPTSGGTWFPAFAQVLNSFVLIESRKISLRNPSGFSLIIEVPVGQDWGRSTGESIFSMPNLIVVRSEGLEIESTDDTSAVLNFFFDLRATMCFVLLEKNRARAPCRQPMALPQYPMLFPHPLDLWQ